MPADADGAQTSQAAPDVVEAPPRPPYVTYELLTKYQYKLNEAICNTLFLVLSLAGRAQMASMT